MYFTNIHVTAKQLERLPGGSSTKPLYLTVEQMVVYFSIREKKKKKPSFIKLNFTIATGFEPHSLHYFNKFYLKKIYIKKTTDCLGNWKLVGFFIMKCKYTISEVVYSSVVESNP